MTTSKTFLFQCSMCYGKFMNIFAKTIDSHNKMWYNIRVVKINKHPHKAYFVAKQTMLRNQTDADTSE